MRSAAAAVCCRTFEICASCVRGWVKWRTYWMKAWMSPTVMAFCTASHPPRTLTAT